jgi:hypothetical protein
MGLLWTFMGASAAYTIFTGLGELVGGLLLTTRRTALAGALVSAAVMTHVAVLNFCYDVPVKLFSMVLSGTMDGKKVHATMHLDAEKEFLLTTRGFHWINEVPFNR